MQIHKIIAWALLLMTGAAWAEPERDVIEFNIPEQALASALREYSRQSNVQLIYRPREIRGLRSAGLAAAVEPIEALSRLLIGTGLGYEQTAEDVVTLFASGSVAEPASLPGASISGEGIVIEEIIVTAARREEALSTLPMSVTVLTGEVLANAQFTDFVDAANWIPSLHTSSTGGMQQSSYAMRGQPGTSLGGRSVDVLVDGATSTTAYYASNPALLDFERIEVIRGSQGTLYGQNSLAGTIKYVSVHPRHGTWESDAQLSGWATSSGEPSWSGRAVLNIPLGDPIAIRLGVSHEDHGGFIDVFDRDPATQVPTNVVEKDFNYRERTALRGALSWLVNDRLETYLTARYQSVEELFSNLETLSRDPPGGERLVPFATYLATPSGTEYQHVPEENATTVTMRAVYAFDGLDLISETTYFNDEYRSAFTAVNVFPEFEVVQHLDGTQVQENVSQEFRLTSAGESAIEWVAGIHWRDESLREDYDVDAVTYGYLLTSMQTIDRRQTSAYGNASYRATDRFSLDAGLRWLRDELDRYRYFQYTFEGAEQPPSEMGADARFDTWSPRLAARYSLYDGAFLYASVAKGFRGGAVNMLGAGAPPELESADPDTNWTYELGLKGRWLAGRITGNAVLFFNDWDDIQTRVLEEWDGQTFSVVVNGESARIWGLEYDFKWIPTDHLSLSLAGHLADSELVSSIRGEQGPSNSGISEGNELTYAPRWGITASADMIWPMESGRELYAGVYLQARAGSYSSLTNEPISKSPSYQQGNIRFGIRSGPWNVEVFAKNVWNERGYTYQQGAFGYDQIGFGAVIYPRRVGITVRHRF